jgi:hypothetical protein
MGRGETGEATEVSEVRSESLGKPGDKKEGALGACKKPTRVFADPPK